MLMVIVAAPAYDDRVLPMVSVTWNLNASAGCHVGIRRKGQLAGGDVGRGDHLAGRDRRAVEDSVPWLVSDVIVTLASVSLVVSIESEKPKSATLNV